MVQPAIKAALSGLSSNLLRRPGSVFYSGRSAFEAPSEIYVLGLNPGGSPLVEPTTIGEELTSWALSRGARWSAYLDETWAGHKAGTYGMQPRLAHMFGQLKSDLRDVPAANVVFVRSRDEAALEAEKATLLASCWPVHAAVIHSLRVRVVLALGRTAGRWVRDALGVQRLIASYREMNGRGWTSEAHEADDGRIVITLTHPSRADWRNADADPTPLVAAALRRSRGSGRPHG